MKLAECRVLLTGAAGGIGQAAATALLQAGAAVLLTGRSPARLATQARALERRFGLTPERVDWRAADLATADGPGTLARQAGDWGCNVVVHNAGLPAFGRFDDLAPADLRRLLDTNLLAPMLLTQALLPHLSRLPRAQVVCVGSALGRIGLPGYAAYSASKFGLRGFAEALRRELAGGPVRVQYFGPRSTRTDFNDARAQAFTNATGSAMDSPETVAAALVRFIEDEAAERFVGFPEKLAVRLNGLAPTWLDRSLSAQGRHLPPATPSLT